MSETQPNEIEMASLKGGNTIVVQQAPKGINMFSPQQTWDNLIAVGIKKTNLPLDRLSVLGFMAGVYISMGAFLAIKTSTNWDETIVNPDGTTSTVKASAGLKSLIFAATFPLGLMFVLINGAELFTGNHSALIPALVHKKITLQGLAKSWGICFLTNFLGSLFWAYFFVYLTDAFEDEPFKSRVQGIAEKKVDYGWGQVFLLAIGCNWLVNLAVTMSNQAHDVLAKMVGTWFPIMAFVALGFEHSVANMFFIPLGMMYGADVSVGQFLWNNLIPVTLGNIFGGAFFVGFLHTYIHIWNTEEETKKPKARV
mmetsp:Transcript_2273/g.2360  ORF Transcript_2273/g.2360 Transcript_2273/m.2360 type:complete len:311 (-) Transcript_2273:237-1169(-)